MKKHTRLLVLVFGVVFIGGWGVTPASAAAQAREGRPAMKKGDDRKGGAERAADRKGKGGKEDTEKAEKKPLGKPDEIMEKTIDSVEQQFPKIAELRKEIADLQSDLLQLKDVTGTRERKKAEQDIPKVERKLANAVEKLEKEVAKVSAPDEEAMAKLKQQEEDLVKKLDAIQSKGRSSEKLDQELDGLRVRKRQLEDRLTAFEYLGQIEEDESK